MKKMNKKGFTIVELVIVIAVIAVLAGVLIPTFGGIIEKAEKSNALQTVKNTYTVILYSDAAVNGSIASEEGDPDVYVVVDDKYYFSIEDGKIEEVDKNDVSAVKATLKEEATAAADWENVTNKIDDIADGVKVYKYTAAVVTP